MLADKKADRKGISYDYSNMMDSNNSFSDAWADDFDQDSARKRDLKA